MLRRTGHWNSFAKATGTWSATAKALFYLTRTTHSLASTGRSHPPAPEAVRGLLEESERTIFELQQQSGFDLYWRIYFWLLRR